MNIVPFNSHLIQSRNNLNCTSCILPVSLVNFQPVGKYSFTVFSILPGLNFYSIILQNIMFHTQNYCHLATTTWTEQLCFMTWEHWSNSHYRIGGLVKFQKIFLSMSKSDTPDQKLTTGQVHKLLQTFQPKSRGWSIINQPKSIYKLLWTPERLLLLLIWMLLQVDIQRNWIIQPSLHCMPKKQKYVYLALQIILVGVNSNMC